MNPLLELQEKGQSVWYDNIRRGLLTSGELQKMIDEDGVRGVTSNPTIFEKAISGSTDYDEAIRDLVAKKKSIKDIFDALTVKDIQMAADLFRRIYDQTEGQDGFVSIEVAPSFSHDTDGTIAEAKRLWKLVDRPNVMVKIPATKEGIPAIEQCLADGLNINITLIFSLERYAQVIGAYRSAMEKRVKANKDVSRVASVASFFVSRIDTSVDKLLQEKIQASQSAKEKDALLELIGKVAVANAKTAYQIFKEQFGSPWFEALSKKGARVQRPLWASTGTKNPNYSDVLYVEELVGGQTVNTMPHATVAAFRDHGKARLSLEEDAAGARDTLDRLKKAGIDLGRVTAQLELEGEKLFSESYEKLVQRLTAKKEMIQAGSLDRQTMSLGKWEAAVKSALDDMERDKVAERLWARDASLWKSEPEVQAKIRNRLGWLNLAFTMSEQSARLRDFAADVRKAGFTHAVLLGMGGSSLCPEVLLRTFGSKKGFPAFFVLDTTDPGAIAEVEKQVNLDKTLFVVSSKSGGTIEMNSLFKYFFGRVQLLKKERAGENFVAITDSETALEKLAREKHFRVIFSSPSDVGGRYSALTLFGLTPAALLGIDVAALLDRAERMTSGCASCVPARENPGVRLGAALGVLGKAGRDKLTFALSPEIASFGTWVEQLVAESTGKEGKGVVPVDGEEIGAPESYGADRVFVQMKVGDKEEAVDAKLAALEAAGHPVIRIALNDSLDLAQEFLRWEVATSVAGVVLGINPFDEPNVTESKENTGKILDKFRSAGKLPEEAPIADIGGAQVWADAKSAAAVAAPAKAGKSLAEVVSAHIAQAAPGGYVAVMAYVTPDDAHHKALQKLRHRVRELTHAATTLGYGPRFLHSTGQLHKGGPNKGVFIQITMQDAADPTVPGEFYGFSTLKNAQALGDFEALKNHSCRVLRIRTGEKSAQEIEALAKSLEKTKTPA